MTEDLVLERSADRRVQVCHEGRSDDPLVVYLHGSPSSRLDIAYAAGRNEDLGVHVAAFDRPGYGGSDYHRFTLASLADDTVAVAEALGYRRFAVLGFSAGSATAVATAALHPDRVAALGISGGAAPFPDIPEELASLSDGERRALDMVTTDEEEAERLLAAPDRAFLEVLGGPDEAVIDLWRSVLGPADRELLADPRFAAFFAATHRESLRQGQRGWARDNVVRMPRWPIDTSRIKAPAWFWYGEQDVVAYGTWLKSRITHGELVVRAGMGHFFVFQEWDLIVRTLSQRP
jgi:pimeloyl-ACP methyl ester carboxylesterase